MQKIKLYVKNNVKEKDLSELYALQKEKIDNIELQIEEEKVSRQPIISKAAPGIEGPVNEIIEYTQHLLKHLNATALIRIMVEGVIYDGILKVIKSGKKLIASNNHQKGNAWGAKLEITKENEKGRQTFHFFLDNIPEDKIYECAAKIEDKIKKLHSAVGEMYMKEIKNIGFVYVPDNDDWGMFVVEKFDGSVNSSL